MSIQRILLPVDGSEYSERACEKAIEQAAAFGAKVFVLHCHETIAGFVAVYLPDDAEQRIEERSRELLAEYATRLEEAGVRHMEISATGSPSRVIADVAKQEEIDLIVMGSRGKRGITDVLMGPVTREVLHTSPTPVLVVH
jgi:nucleotide-binding universal stress UspA family protein